jgi:tRNA(Ile)-lysidine synthase TilS/MesJ
VKNWCDKYNLEYFCRELPAHLRESRNFQENTRNWRRKESLNILQSLPTSDNKYIATAHNREDQVETYLLKLLRGAFITNSLLVTIELVFFFLSIYFLSLFC